MTNRQCTCEADRHFSAEQRPLSGADAVGLSDLEKAVGLIESAKEAAYRANRCLVHGDRPKIAEAYDRWKLASPYIAVDIILCTDKLDAALKLLGGMK